MKITKPEENMQKNRRKILTTRGFSALSTDNCVSRISNEGEFSIVSEYQLSTQKDRKFQESITDLKDSLPAVICPRYNAIDDQNSTKKRRENHHKNQISSRKLARPN